jgi:DNA gyrase/topoisomerase IV subunit A
MPAAGGIILADHGIANMYTTGSGSILLRAKVDIEYEGAKRRRPAGAPSAAAAATGSRRGRGRGATSRSAADAGEEGDVDGKALIVVTEMPYQTNKVSGLGPRMVFGSWHAFCALL